MASIGSESGDRKCIPFVAPDGKRKTLRIGKASDSVAGKVKAEVELLLEAIRTGRAPKASTLERIKEQEPKFRAKLANLGLIDAPEHKQRETLKAFTDRCIASKVSAKPRTVELLECAAASLVAYFGPDKPIDEITSGHAKAYREHLLVTGSSTGGRLSLNTVNGRIKKAKAFFASAVEFRLLDSNPFAKLPCTVRSNRSRMAYVTKADIEKVIDAASDAEFRLLVALCRYAGLRNPSETLSLKWEHIRLDGGRMNVQSPKTAHHEGKASRWVPILPELRPYLEDAWELCQDPSAYVIRRWRDSQQKLPDPHDKDGEAGRTRTVAEVVPQPPIKSSD
jgi:integrase